MARLARVVAAGFAHHVTQRGNCSQQVFFCDEDCRRYLGLVQHYSLKAKLHLVGYCLMSNHVRLVVVPEREDSLARALGPAHCRYAQWMHARRHCVGHLWQNRFFSTVLDEAHLVAAMRYVERNPVRAGLVAEAAEYVWSSVAAHVTGRDASGTPTGAHGDGKAPRLEGVRCRPWAEAAAVFGAAAGREAEEGGREGRGGRAGCDVRLRKPENM